MRNLFILLALAAMSLSASSYTVVCIGGILIPGVPTNVTCPGFPALVGGTVDLIRIDHHVSGSGFVNYNFDGPGTGHDLALQYFNGVATIFSSLTLEDPLVYPNLFVGHAVTSAVSGGVLPADPAFVCVDVTAQSVSGFWLGIGVGASCPGTGGTAETPEPSSALLVVPPAVIYWWRRRGVVVE
jgi:hypothetical protein